MFRGIHSINLDSKGRLAVPKRFREVLHELCEGKLVATIDTEAACLLLYPLHEWEEIEAKLQKLPSFDRAARRIQRLLIGHATELDIDAQGRVLLPALLRDYAKLDKHMIWLGQGKKFELWDEQLWHAGREQWLAEEASGSDELPDEVKLLSL